MEQTNPSLRNSASYNFFKNNILKFIRPSANKIFRYHNSKGIKWVTRLRLGLSHLQEHKFKHSFQDTLNSLCSCGLDIETKSHYFLHCLLFHTEPSTLLNNINEINSTIFNKSDLVVTRILLYGNKSFNYWFCFVYKQIWWTTLSSLNSGVFFFLFIFSWLQLDNCKGVNF